MFANNSYSSTDCYFLSQLNNRGAIISQTKLCVTVLQSNSCDNQEAQHCTFVVVVARPLPRDGGMAEDHGAPEDGQLPRAWTRDRRETESPKSERRKQSVAGQSRMR